MLMKPRIVAAKRQRYQSSPSLILPIMMLRVELKPEPADEIELRFEEIDVVFLVRHQLLEQVACHIVLRGVAVISAARSQSSTSLTF